MTDEPHVPEQPLSAVTRNPFLRRNIERRNTGRSQRMGGALIAVAVAIVMFIGLTVWYTDGANIHILRMGHTHTTVAELGETAAVHALATRCHDTYPQLAKSSSAYWAALDEIDLTAPDAGIQQADLLTRVLALESDSADALVGLMRLDLAGVPTLIKEQERASLFDAIERFAPETPGVEALRKAAGFVPEINEALDTPRPDDY